MKRKLRNIRPKAIFGTQEAATLAAAAIQAAATSSAAIVGRKATEASARTQADAMTRSAQLQSEAIEKQGEINKEMTTKSIEANKEINAQNRQLQKDIQMTIQMMAGQENMNEAKRESKIVVRNGGSANKSPLLRVGSNQPIRVVDGGYARPIGRTPEGFNMYELRGDNHEQYHKTNGKYKSGVGVKTSDGEVIEGEGNGNSNQGELVVTTPTDVLFLSKHNIKGFNPVEAVKQGMNPVEAFAIQENIKDVNNISDDGKKKAKMGCRKLRLAGGNTLTDNALGVGLYPLSADSSAAMLGATYNYSSPVEEDINSIARNGKRIRLRAKNGRCKALAGEWYPLIGGGVNALGNIIGAGVTASGNRKAGNIMRDAYTNAGDIIADAYGRLTGIDESIIDRENFSVAKYLPVVRSARYIINPQITAINRGASVGKRAVDNTTMSSAARLARKGRIDADAALERSKIYATQANAEEQIAQGNAERLSEAAAKNAELETQANKDYIAARLDVAKYNADVKNQSILGTANARANAITQGQGAYAQGIASARQAWGSGIAGAGQSLSTGLQGYANYKLTEAYLKAISTGENPFDTPDLRGAKYVIGVPDEDGKVSSYTLAPNLNRIQRRRGLAFARRNGLLING